MPSFWSQRTSIEKGLIITVGLVTVLAVVFLAVILTMLFQHSASLHTTGSHILRKGVEPTKEDSMSVCITPDCVNAASKLLLDLDENIDPCNDFYEFTCGSFLKNTMIPDEDTRVDNLYTTDNKLQERIRSLLEEPIKSNEPRPFMLAKRLYQACMNTTEIEARGSRLLQDLLRRLGGWPVVDGDSWNENHFSWKDSVYIFHDIGIFTDLFLNFFSLPDLKNNTKYAIFLDQAELGLNRENLINGFSDNVVLAYYDYMVDIAKLLGAEKNWAEVEMKESLVFEMKLANISLPGVMKRNLSSSYNPMTIEQLIDKFPNIPWLEYINRLLAPYVVIGPEEIIIVMTPKYITGLEELLKITPKRVQANYIMWRCTKVIVAHLPEALRHRELRYKTALSGENQLLSRWKECTTTTNDRMSIAVGALYIRKYFNEQSKVTAREMVDEIRQQFYKILTKIDWMDNQTRSAALDKAKSMVLHVAYPQEMLDDHKLIDHYSGLDVISNKWIESLLNLHRFKYDNSFRIFRKPVDKTDWVSFGKPAWVNAGYDYGNKIVLLAGILQPPFYSAKRPAYMNYGSMGYIIGHEITHGFDDQGSEFDKSGNKFSWWQEESKKKYLKKTKCIIDQYSNYTITQVGLKVDGNYTQGENIADNGGIKVAYYAYQAWTKRHGDEPRLPGLQKYTPNQLFWLSSANTWCAVYRDAYLKSFMDPHPPNRFRVIGTVSNMEEFAKDFKCPAGSQMNPQEKCAVW